jgi:small subunit ribosomal protein S1
MDKQHSDSQQGSFSTLIEDDYDYNRPRRGQVCRATVLSVGENEIIVDLGTKRDGTVRRTDLELLDDDYRASLQVGDSVPVYVTNVSDPQGELVVSLNQGLIHQDWLRAQDLLESGEILKAEAIDFNRGGAIVQFGRLRGFVPNSHLTAMRRGLREGRLRRVKSELLGQTLSLVVIEVDQRRRRLVLSRLAADWRRRQQLLAELTEGQIRTGVVSNLVDFGVFVDLGGLDGLVHISELDWKHVMHPSEVLSVGDEVEVYVLKVDRKRERVGLSRKRLLPDPWPRVAGELQADQVVQGTVTHVVEFGVFVDLGEGVEGLVHASEIPDGEVAWRDLEPGSPITVRVLKINRWRRRIALSLRDVAEAIPSLMLEEMSPVLAVVEQ